MPRGRTLHERPTLRMTDVSVPPNGTSPQRYVLVGDGESPHLVKWVQALRMARPALELWLVSSRGSHAQIQACIPPERQLLLRTTPAAQGGNASILQHLPRVARWMRAVQPQVVHAHYLTSHGTLAWLACRWWRVPGTLVVSAWGSDVLVTPWRSWWLRALTRAVLRGADVCTADSQHLADTMRTLDADDLQVFPFGLMTLPPNVTPQSKSPWLFFSNRGLEPLYRIDRVLALFAQVAAVQPLARLVIANQGSELARWQAWVAQKPWASQVQFVGYLDAQAQAVWYAKAQWYCSAPESDSVSVSVLEAMAHGCIPLLSDLPANRELVPDASAGWVLPDALWHDGAARVPTLQQLRQQAPAIAQRNHAWVEAHALFPQAVDRFLCTLPGLP